MLWLQVVPDDRKVDEGCSREELTRERARLAGELADAKKKFMAVAKRKQQEYTKKVGAQASAGMACCASRAVNSLLL